MGTALLCSCRRVTFPVLKTQWSIFFFLSPSLIFLSFSLAGVAAQLALTPWAVGGGRHIVCSMAQTTGTVNLASKGLGGQALARPAKVASKRAQVCPPRNAVKEVFMPALSSTMTEGKIVSWLKSPGDKVKKGESIVVVESGARGRALPRLPRSTATAGTGG